MGTSAISGSGSVDTWGHLTEAQLNPEQRAQYDQVMQDFAVDLFLDPLDIIMDDDLGA